MSCTPPPPPFPDDPTGDDPRKPVPRKSRKRQSCWSRVRELARRMGLKDLSSAIDHLEKADYYFHRIRAGLHDASESHAAPVVRSFSFSLKPTGCARVQIDDLPPFMISPHLASLLWPLAQDWGTSSDEIVAFKTKSVLLEAISKKTSAPVPARRLPSSLYKLRGAFAKHGFPESLIETDRKQGMRLRVLRTTRAQAGRLLPGG